MEGLMEGPVERPSQSPSPSPRGNTDTGTQIHEVGKHMK